MVLPSAGWSKLSSFCCYWSKPGTFTKHFFATDNSEEALHGSRMTTAIDTTNSSFLVWNFINQSSVRFEDERREPKANMTSPVINNPLNSNKKHKNRHNQTLTAFRIELSDPEYKGGWHDPPFVIEKYKLLFFSTAKVGCTHWHLLFMRMIYNRTYASHQEGRVHEHAVSQLKLLRHYSVQQATHMMTSPDWTRAIFLRDPLERFVSAYLDKALGPDDYVQRHCCGKHSTSCRRRLKQSAEAAFPIMKQCNDIHWKPQNQRISHKYMQQVNFVGRMETMQKIPNDCFDGLAPGKNMGHMAPGHQARPNHALPVRIMRRGHPPK